MPGEERKFRRLRIVAFIPTCKRGGEAANAHTLPPGGTPGVAVIVGSPFAVKVGAAAVVFLAVVAVSEGGGWVAVSENTSAAVALGSGGTSVSIADVAEAASTGGGNGVRVGTDDEAVPLRSRISKRSNKRIAAVNFITLFAGVFMFPHQSFCTAYRRSASHPISKPRTSNAKALMMNPFSCLVGRNFAILSELKVIKKLSSSRGEFPSLLSACLLL